MADAGNGGGNFYKWTDEDIRVLIVNRTAHGHLFSGWRNAAQHGWEAVLKEIGLLDVVSPARAAKKWENFKKKYKEL
ncbi:hypothetical protein PO909_020889, partial [Leuciscus waleckii]